MAVESTVRVALVVENTAYPLITNISIDPKDQLVFHPCLTTAFTFALEVAMNRTFAKKRAREWGQYDEITGNWTGMIGYLANGEADFSVTAMTDEAARRKVLDYSLSTFKGRYSAFYLRPSFRASAMGLIQPFGASIWLASILFLVAAASGCLVDRLVHSDKMVAGRPFWPSFHPGCKKVGSDDESWNFAQAVGLLCSRSIAVMVKSRYASENGVTVTLASTGFLLSSLYGGMVLAFLMSRYHSFQSAEQLSTSSYVFGIANTYPVRQHFKDEKRFDMEAAAARGFNGLEEAKSRILAGSYAFVTEDWRGYYALLTEFAEDERCLIGEVPMAKVSQSFSTAVAKNSPYRRIVDYHIMQFKQYGLSNLWIRRYIPSRPECIRGEYESIYLEGMLAAFYGLLICAAVSMLVLCGEFAVWVMRKEHCTNHNIVP